MILAPTLANALFLILCERIARRRAYLTAWWKTVGRTKKYNSNPKRKLETDRAWRKRNPEKVKTWTNRWRANNPDKVRNQWRRGRKRKEQKPAYRLEKNLRKRIRGALKGTRKFYRTSALVGCSTLALRLYLAGQFQPGMTWENYGSVWHVDHIRPCAKFDLRDPAQQRACFHYSNLRPLWAIDNLRKGAKSQGEEGC